MGKSKLTEDDIKDIETMIRDGYKYRIIAMKYGVDESRIRQIRKERNIEVYNGGRLLRTFKKDGTAYTQEEIDSICDMYKSGISIADIARTVEANYYQIHRILKIRDLVKPFEVEKDIEEKICKLYNLGINLTLIKRILELEGSSVSIFRISECLRTNNIPTRQYCPDKDIHLRNDIINLKYEYGMDNNDIAIVVNRSVDRVRRVLLEYKKTQSET